jgi:hypothetical protein
MFSAVEKRSTFVHGGVVKVTPRRYINEVLLKHLASGKLVWRQGTHVGHHIESRGLPRVTGQLLGQNGRAKLHFGILAQRIPLLAKTAPVLGSGDLNVDYFAEKDLSPYKRCPWFPYTTLGKVSRIVVPVHGTHGGRLIDWGWCTPGVQVISCVVLLRGNSDHNPVSTTVELT